VQKWNITTTWEQHRSTNPFAQNFALNSHDKEAVTIFDTQHLFEWSICWVIFITAHGFLFSTFQCLNATHSPLYLAECKSQSNITVYLQILTWKMQEMLRAICLRLTKHAMEILGWAMQLCWVHRQIISNIREINRRTAIRMFYCINGKLA